MSAPKDTHHYVLTFTKPDGLMSYRTGTLRLGAAATESAAFDFVLAKHDAADGVVLFYRLVPLVPAGLPPAG